MDELVQKYNAGKYDDCIDILYEEDKEDDTLIEDLIKRNCLNLCQCLDMISKDDTSDIKGMHYSLYKTYQNIAAAGLPGALVPLQLELTALYNYIWWNLYYIDVDENLGADIMGHLVTIHRGLRRGISCKQSNSMNLLEDILHDARTTGQKLKIKDYYYVSLLTETIGLTILFILKVDRSPCIVEKCLEVLSVVGEDLDPVLTGLSAVKNCENPCPLYDKLFKFGCSTINASVLNTGACSIEFFYIVKAACFCIMRMYGAALLIVKKHFKSGMKSLWCYVGGLSACMLGDLTQSLGFVIMSTCLSLDISLTARFSILQGQISSRKGNYKEALKHFWEAKMMSPELPTVYYYMGEEYGKMGLNDDMVECFQTVLRLQVKESEKMRRKHRGLAIDFASIIVDLIHPADEISEAEATYAAAVACGLNERYRESAELFEKYVKVCLVAEETRPKGERIVKTPNFVTALHEAATMNILIGNASQSRRLLAHASNVYTRMDHPAWQPKGDVHVTKDANLIRRLLHEQLGLKGSNQEEENGESVVLFAEEMVQNFDDDVIGLMLSAEMDEEGEVDAEAHKATLARLISNFSKYLAQMQRKESVSAEEKVQLTLVKALSGKTFLNIAKCQVGCKASAVETERTFKRALTCNQGDKDVLCEYCKFLLERGRSVDAQKLWKTFSGKEPAVTVDRCQGLALRHLLRSHVTRTELETIRMDVEPSGMDLGCQFIN